MELSEEMTLIPTWPVVVTSAELILSSDKNRVPMELGMRYSLRYWNSYKKNNG